jgi:multidrug efflux pump subunit AcrB
MPYETDEQLIRTKYNTSRFFVEHRQIAWAALIAVVMWGVYGYFSMPQRKDPDIPVRVAVAVCRWPGATAQEVEQLVTRPIEETIAQNKTIHPAGPDNYGIRSISLPGVSFVYVNLAENVADTKEQFSDISLKLQTLAPQLPSGVTGIQFQSDFGDTAALMMTVASPLQDDFAIEIRARSVEDAIRSARTASGGSKVSAGARRVTIVYTFPLALSASTLGREVEDGRRNAEKEGILEQSRLVSGRGFVGVDGFSVRDDTRIEAYLQDYTATHLRESEFDPDTSGPVIIHDVSETPEKLKSVGTAKYTYAQLDDFTNLIARTLLGVPQTSRVDRSGVLPQAVYLTYSQERLASYGLQVTDLGPILQARNIILPAGTIEAGDRQIRIDPSGKFDDAQAIGNVLAGTQSGPPTYLRDLVDISRGYRGPPDFLNFYTATDSDGKPRRYRAITIAVYMRSGEQIRKFGEAVDEQMKQVRAALPADLIIARTSDQPLQVKENIDLFMEALYEAIGLVVMIALIGFWEWRSALLMALSIPITLAMTFGMANMVQVDLQQVSIATLIIALGLLVDDPVVANDAIKRQLGAGIPRLHASWLGPTKLARAILYATATNIISYLPFLMLTGSTGDFLRSLPIVMTAALVSSRLVSMTFIPLLGYYFLRPRKNPEPPIEERRRRGFYGAYYRLAGLAIHRRWAVLGMSLVFLGSSFLLATKLKSQFFPDDVQYWSYVDVWLPNDAPLSLTNDTSKRAEDIVRRVAQNYRHDHPVKDSHELLNSMTTFVGGGGPRFWFSVSPEQPQRNYAQVLIRLNDKEAIPGMIGQLQSTLANEVPGAYLTVHQLQTNPVEFPVEIRLSGTSDVDPNRESADNEVLRSLATQAEDILRSIPGVQVVQDDWFAESPEVKLRIDPDRANMAGVTNRDVAASATAAMSGTTVTTLRQGNQQIPVIARLRAAERAQLSDVENLYVYSSQGPQKIPLRSVSSVVNEMTTGHIRRQEHFRTIGVHAFPVPGVLSSEVLQRAMPEVTAFGKTIPPGYRMEIGGERAKQQSGFANLAQVLAISLLGIYGALLLQFGNAAKPLIVFAATPYGVAGALVCLAVMGSPFGFMAFLGIASLIGVIVSHVIVLFDFIEEMHQRGEPFEQAIRDAGIERLRPVLITVGATILALFPLAIHGGPLWKPLCYAQIGGLAVATFITLLLVPVFYSIAVLDLRIVKWETARRAVGPGGS